MRRRNIPRNQNLSGSRSSSYFYRDETFWNDSIGRRSIGTLFIKALTKKQTKPVRQYVVAAVLRDIEFDQEKYDGFIELQDKLHNNICRKRTLVAIGTHDLDTIQGPFRYEAREPKNIDFIPLNKTESMNGTQLLDVYQVNLKSCLTLWMT